MSRNGARRNGGVRGQDLTTLERQVERGSLFTHTVVSRNSDQIHEIESFLYGVIDVLIAKGLLTREEIVDSVETLRRQMVEDSQSVGPGIALRVDEDGAEQDNFVPVDCSERIHICKAVCCRLHFALTAEEIESGKVKWDLGAPYYIRQDEAGCCQHLDPESRGCSVYKDRPGVCRKYSCANDARIWKDFDKMILNEEWIDENLHPSKPRLVTARMLPDLTTTSGAGDDDGAT